MTLAKLFAKYGIPMSQDNALQIGTYTITVSYDRRFRAIIVENDFDNQSDLCITPKQAASTILRMAENIVNACFQQECHEIAQDCVNEGYPSHGSNYDMRVDQLENYYDEMFWFIYER